ncbi:unnamed protein product [Sphagnum jensenii]
MELLQFDVKMIFLHGDLEEEVYPVTQGLELKKILPGELQKIQIQAEELLKILPGELLRSATRSMEDSTRTAEVELEILFRG